MPLLDLVTKHALQFGDFTLANGKKAKFYLDCRRLTLNTEGLFSVTMAVSNAIDDLHFDAIGGPCVGADPIVGAMLLWYGQVNISRRGFLIRKEEKQHGIGGLVIGSVQPGDRVVVVEDVATTGDSLLRAVDEIEDFGCRVVKAIVIVDRLEGAAEKFAARKIPYEALLTVEDLGLKDAK